MEKLTQDLFKDPELEVDNNQMAGRCLNYCATAIGGGSVCITLAGCVPSDRLYDIAP